MGRKAVGIDINKKYKKKFKDEVLIGAEKYWHERIKKKFKEQKQFIIFKENNQKLRKIKASIKLKSNIKDLESNNDFIYIATNDIEDKLNLYLITSKKNFHDFNGLIEKISREHKVKINISTISKKAFSSLHKENTFFSYEEKQIYKYNKSYSLEQIFNNNIHEDVLFSNIKVNINIK